MDPKVYYEDLSTSNYKLSFLFNNDLSVFMHHEPYKFVQIRYLELQGSFKYIDYSIDFGLS